MGVVDVASLGVMFVKGPVIARALWRVGSNFGKFIEETSIAKNIVEKGRTVIVEARAKAVKPTGTVRDSVKATQPEISGAGIPKSFELSTDGAKVWVHGNATDHFAEAAKGFAARGLSPEAVKLQMQQQLRSMQAAVAEATKGGVPLNQRLTVGGWQLEFRQGAGDLLPALIHARMVG
ncbi:hypothetical protein F0L68_11240 [Solihabitans fulvus]|uniref:Uncharacterized protein n=1 Tax=Solihabitans fulvus TaxID=1892852 RepID=A0A5B2XJ47_9PSEU|nr:hypothetical protein [Solihabitans fulvus]KAA2263019.1 hypothetical protein F0L68_11240 [Solihabitans fulvus]